MTKILMTLCLVFLGFQTNAQIIPGNPDGIYAGGRKDLPTPQDPANPPPNTGAFYDWGMGRDRTGYCYQFTNHGDVLNGGHPVAESFCEAVKASHADWARGKNGYGYCYQFTPDELVMFQGRPQKNEICEAIKASYFSWGRGFDGWTYCFQFTPYNAMMNEGRSVPNEKCY